MHLVLRKCATDEIIRLSGGKVLSRKARQLAYLAPAAGQWVFYSLSGTESRDVFYNRLPAPARCPVAVGDLLELDGLALVIESIEVEPQTRVVGTDETAQPAVARDTAETPVPRSQKIDLVYRKAKELCQQLLPALREPDGKLQRKVSCGSIWGWLKIFRRPGNPAETLDRLHFLLSRSPRDRVWLFELARFLFQQSYHGLCLRVLKELSRLYPHDAEVAETLAKFYFQQGRNPTLPAGGRLSAFEHAERCTRLVRRLAPNDQSLANLVGAVRKEQTLLRQSLSGSPRNTSVPKRAQLMEKMA